MGAFMKSERNSGSRIIGEVVERAMLRIVAHNAVTGMIFVCKPVSCSSSTVAYFITFNTCGKRPKQKDKGFVGGLTKQPCERCQISCLLVVRVPNFSHFASCHLIGTLVDTL